jgi:hypothetical protein
MRHVAVGAPPRKYLVAYYIQAESRQTVPLLAARRRLRRRRRSRRIAMPSPRNRAAPRANSIDCRPISIGVTFSYK